jgi:hypothetical protein
MRLSQFLENFGDKDIASILPSMIGLSVRKMYAIQPGNGQDASINDPERRIKRITQFGQLPANQKCRTSVEDTTVARYYKGD